MWTHVNNNVTTVAPLLWAVALGSQLYSHLLHAVLISNIKSIPREWIHYLYCNLHALPWTLTLLYIYHYSPHPQFKLCTCVSRALWCACEVRTTSTSWFSPMFMWNPKITPRSSGLSGRHLYFLIHLIGPSLYLVINRLIKP